jgi:hypothetical protein
MTTINSVKEKNIDTTDSRQSSCKIQLRRIYAKKRRGQQAGQVQVIFMYTDAEHEIGKMSKQGKQQQIFQ